MIDPRDRRDRQFLLRSVRLWRERTRPVRRERRKLVASYINRPVLSDFYGASYRDGRYALNSRPAMLNMMQLAVLAHVIQLAWRGPKYSVVARRFGEEGTIAAARIQSLLNAYVPLSGLGSIFRRVALDSAFGWGVTKVGVGPAPKGIYGSEFAPRCWRVDPMQFLADGTSPSFDEAMYLGDLYLMPLDEARGSQFFDPAIASRLAPWTGNTRSEGGMELTEAYAQQVTRLVDIYLPSSGLIATWPAPTDEFSAISGMPLSVRPTPFNPYDVMAVYDSPQSLHEIAPTGYVHELHKLSNDMMSKAATQARQSKRNVVFRLGSGPDAMAITNAEDGEAVGLTQLKDIDTFQYPGVDPQITNMLGLAQAEFKEQGGNIDAALGLNPTAPTARQSAQQLQQIGARQSVNRQRFEEIAGSVGEKIATLAMADPLLQLDIREPVPGLDNYYIPMDWGPQFPVTQAVNEFNFEVVPFSMAYRSPEERLAQLQQASMEFVQMMSLASQGAPIDIGAVLRTIAEYRDIPELLTWWTGGPPEFGQGETTGQRPPQGSVVQYQGGFGGAFGGDPFSVAVPPPGGEGGFSNPQQQIAA